MNSDSDCDCKQCAALSPWRPLTAAFVGSWHLPGKRRLRVCAPARRWNLPSAWGCSWKDLQKTEINKKTSQERVNAVIFRHRHHFVLWALRFFLLTTCVKVFEPYDSCKKTKNKKKTHTLDTDVIAVVHGLPSRGLPSKLDLTCLFTCEQRE